MNDKVLNRLHSMYFWLVEHEPDSQWLDWLIGNEITMTRSDNELSQGYSNMPKYWLNEAKTGVEAIFKPIP